MKKILTLAALVIIAKHSIGQQSTQNTKYLDTFYVFLENGKNVITWKSKTEKDVGWFYVERSTNGVEYSGAILYSPGDLHKNLYQYKDSKAANTIYSYRILVLSTEKEVLDVQYIYIEPTKQPRSFKIEERYTKIPCLTRDFLVLT